MEVQVGDVWVDEDGTIRNVLCENNGGKFGYRSAFSDGGYMMAERKAEDIMRDSKLMKRGKINRPGAGCECQRHIALVFGICTGEEFDSHNAEIVVLDSEGELPKVEEKGYEFKECKDYIGAMGGYKYCIDRLCQCVGKRYRKFEAKGYVDCPVYEKNGFLVYKFDGIGLLLHTAVSRKALMGYVWGVNGYDELRSDCVLWRGKTGNLYTSYKNGRTIEYCKAVRFNNSKEK